MTHLLNEEKIALLKEEGKISEVINVSDMEKTQRVRVARNMEFSKSGGVMGKVSGDATAISDSEKSD